MTPGSLRSRARCQLPRNQFREIRGKDTPPGIGRGVLFLMKTRTVHIGLLGLGHVGSAVVEALRRNGMLFARRTGALPVVIGIAVRHLQKQRRVVVDPELLTDDAWTVVRDSRVEIVVEAIGGVAPADAYLKEALRQGKSVVTANKQLVCACASELEKLATHAGRVFAYEASVGGALPVIRLLRESLVGDRIDSLVAIINGTANYVLTQMEGGMPFEEALAAAQALGLAEPDPADDVDGRDAAAKLAILASLAFGSRVRPDQIPHQGIRDVCPSLLREARDAGSVIRLLAVARCRGGRIEAGVFPALLPISHPLASLRDECNGVLLRTDLAGELFVTGRGAGGVPTASAILADLAEAVSGGQVLRRESVTTEVVPLSHALWRVEDDASDSVF